jgi:hypothetical protein
VDDKERKPMKSTLMAIVLVLSSAGVARAQDIAGDWQGTLKVGEAELRLALHVTKADGGLKATLDSIDQGANGIPVSAITLEGARLKLTVDAVKGTYEGTVNAAATAIEGTWSQGTPLPLAFARAVPKPAATAGPPAKPSDIDGAWLGTLETPGGNLRLAFRITNTSSGLTATLDSLDQGVKGLPVTAVTRNGSSLKMAMKQLAGGFDGTIDGPLATITGTWTQGGGSLPLVLTRSKE